MNGGHDCSRPVFTENTHISTNARTVYQGESNLNVIQMHSCVKKRGEVRKNRRREGAREESTAEGK